MTMRGPILFLEADGGTEIELPWKWEICCACEGHGTDRGANVECDGGGFTASEWAEQDDDFRAAYLSGAYDRPCDGCDGLGRVNVADLARMSPEHVAAWHSQIANNAEARRIDRAERAMGA